MKSIVTSIKTPLTFVMILAGVLMFAPRVAAQSGPILEVSPDTLRFYFNLCWDSSYFDTTLTKSMMVANVGDGDMTWTGAAGEAWAAFDPQSGGNYDSVSVRIDWAYVPQIFAVPQPGDTLLFETQITITSPEASNSPQTVVVQLGYTCDPHGYYLVVQPNYFDFTMAPNDTLWSSFHVLEAYGQSVEFYCDNSSSWLHLYQPFSPQSTPDSVLFTVIAAGLDSGVYYDTIVVTTPAEPSNSPLAIPVRLQVGSGDNIVLVAQPDWFNYTLQEGETGGGDSLYVYEAGGQSINFWTYNESNWLYVDTMAASPLYTPRVLYVNVSAVGLTPGIYTDTIEIMAAEAVNSPLLVPVSLIVESSQPESAINTTPGYFHFTLNTGQTAAEPLQVYETNGQAVDFVMDYQAPWLGITAEPPYTTPMQVIVGVSAVDLQPGFYADTVFITPTSDTTVNPAAVPVYLEVVSDQPRLVSVPSYFYFTLQAGDTLFNTGLWVYEASGDTVPFAAQTLDASPWLHLYTDSLSVTPDSVRFGLFTDGLAPGTYGDTIILYNPLDYPTPYYETIVPIILTIQGEPPQSVIAVDPPAFNFALPSESSAYDTLSVYEIHGDTIPFSYFHHATWLAVNPFGMPPYATPMTMPIVVTSGGLEPGIYIDTIFIGQEFDSTGIGMTAVPVTMIVGGANYVPGDANGDLLIDIGDAVGILNFIFKGGAPPVPMEAADADCDTRVNIGDVVFIINYIFRFGPMPGCF